MTVHKLPAKEPSGYRMVARAASTAEIFLYGVIGETFFGDGITARQFASDLRGLGRVSAIDLRIMSEGGDVFEGRTIYSLLAQHDARIVVHVDGLAASIASLIAMAGDEIRIADGAMMMIHSAWSLAVGNAEELRRTADLLDTVSATLADTYAARTNQDRKKIDKWMAEEKWFTAQEAVDNGFADKVEEPVRAAAKAALSLAETIRARTGMQTAPAIFKHVPAALSPRHIAARARIQAMRDRIA